MIAPKSRQDAPATAARGSDRELRGDGLLDGVGKRRVVGDQDRLRAGVVLGLRQQVGRDPVGMAGLVGEDQHLGGARDHVDADLAEDEPLGRRHIGVAGPDDLGDRRDRRRCRRRAPPPPARRRRDRSRRCRRASPPPARAGRACRPAPAPPSPAAGRPRPWPARRSSARTTDRRRCRPAHRGRPPRSRSSGAPARLRARR